MDLQLNNLTLLLVNEELKSQQVQLENTSSNFNIQKAKKLHICKSVQKYTCALSYY